ncbi:MAG: DNA recombination protein RmuC [Candidatus Zambryskibacteria bacterium CG_4_9_14_3_um_filter_42_9]|uniref:DNA recombination protein RmuC n=1 Tax=Candidatus Zambryskibacteria bacterium CG22_combo_CG10-13_8_21_14_all_42_17 TaxID=1975118 RepID=A0A2H0BCU4_9BACT|nr:MAG: DNA recombination protein RmuC [Candidatus Zambryskibacteria bacterium CG22_combo_CG10-13_8_21_14_all_42_17]PJA36985.1 MAG: DNA recombination protein RmuC [Candidatus Zambryskibacteria bacterium CG_4_9_14_3_um_filter_42_9]
MSNLILVAIIILVIANAVTLFIFARKFGDKKDEKGEEGMRLLLTQINEFSRTVDQKMAETNKMMNESMRTQFGESAKLVREVTTSLTKLDETNKQVISFADQLQSLQDILKNPKQRGILGEYYLETLLKNVLPPGSYQMQYAFPDGNIVDAAVFVKDKIIPIDSKFSLENYNRIIEEKNDVEKEKLEKAFVADLKNRIAETAKYINPSHGTMDFAFMFIPHEAIYYDLIINKIGALKEDSETLIQRAASKYHVLIVSPTSFLAYLQTVLQGLNALHIEEKAVEIIKRVDELGRHLKTYEEYYNKLGSALSTTVNHYNTGYKELGKVDKDVLRITGTGAGFEPLTLDKPRVE